MHVALVTCRAWPQLAPDDRLLVEALRELGVAAEPIVWDDPGADWSAAPVTVVRSPWDYVGRRDEFVAWARRVAEVTDLHNDADVLRWNTHKGYLVELEDRGVPVVPTAFTGAGDQVDLATLRTSRGWKDVVIKPAVSAGAKGTHLIRADAGDGQRLLDDLLAAHDVLIQPYLSDVEQGGELSLMFADGDFTHAVRKLPAAADFRVQEEFAGTTEAVTPSSEVVDLARWVLDATGHEFLYARVDLLRAPDGAWQLAELEVTEPSLYLDHAPDAAHRFARAVAERC